MTEEQRMQSVRDLNQRMVASCTGLRGKLNAERDVHHRLRLRDILALSAIALFVGLAVI